MALHQCWRKHSSMVLVYFYIFWYYDCTWSTGKIMSMFHFFSLSLFELEECNFLTLLAIAGECFLGHICLDEYFIFLHHSSPCSNCCTLGRFPLPMVRMRNNQVLLFCNIFYAWKSLLRLINTVRAFWWAVLGCIIDIRPCEYTIFLVN